MSNYGDIYNPNRRDEYIQPREPAPIQPQEITPEADISGVAGATSGARQFTAPIQIQSKPQEQSYWENPYTVARWHDTISNAAPTWKAPDWLDVNAVKAAYKWMERQNNYNPWYQWKPLPENDPTLSMLRSMPPPPNEALLPGEQQWATNIPQQPQIIDPYAQYQQKVTDWKQLPAWQRFVDTIMNPQPFSGSGRPESSRLVASAINAGVTGMGVYGMSTMLLGGAGAIVGGAPGGAAGLGLGTLIGVPLALGLGGAQFYSNYTGQQIPGLETMMQPFNWLSEGAERTWGLAKLADLEGIDRILQNLPEAWQESNYNPLAFLKNNPDWQAAGLNYETQRTDLINAIAMLAGDKPAGPGEVWQFSRGYAEPVPLLGEGNRGAAAIQEARDAISGLVDQGYSLQEARTKVYADFQDRYGDTGVINDFAMQSVFDPLNYAPGGLGKVGEWGAKAIGKPELATAFRASIGNPVIDSLPPVIQPIVEAIGNKYNKPWLQGSSGPLKAIMDYGANVRDIALSKPGGGVKAVSELDWFDRAVGGLDKDGNVKELMPNTGTGIVGWMQKFQSLTDETKAGFFLKNLLDNTGLMLQHFDDPTAPNDVRGKSLDTTLRKLAGVSSVAVGDAGEAILKSPMTATTSVGLKSFIGSKVYQELMTTFLNPHTQTNIRSLMALADVLDTKDIPKLVQGIGSNPEGIIKQLADKFTEKYPDKPNPYSSLDPKKFQEPYKTFSDMETPWSFDDFRERIKSAMMDHTAKFVKERFGLKEDGVVNRFAGLLKAVQSALLLDNSISYVLNNGVSNPIHRAFDGTLGQLTPSQKAKWWERYGYTPVRLDEGFTNADLVKPAELDINKKGKKEKETIKTYDQAMYELRKAVQGDGVLARLTREVNKGRNKLGMASKLSGILEESEGSQAYTIATQQMWNKLWKPGSGFRDLDPLLATALDNIQPGLSKQIIQAIRSGVNRREIEERLWKDIDSLGNAVMDDVLTDVDRQMFDTLGLSEKIIDALKNTKNSEQAARAIDGIKAEVQDFIDAKVIKDIATIKESVKDRIKGNFSVVSQLFVEMQARVWSRWLEHYREQQNFVEQVKMLPYEAQNAAWRAFNDAEQRSWKRIRQYELQIYAGVLESMNWNTPEAMGMVDAIEQRLKLYDEFYTWKNALYDEFFSGRMNKDKAREDITPFIKIAEEANNKFNEVSTLAAGIQGQVDALLSKMFTDPGQETLAMEWRQRVAAIQGEMDTARKQFWTDVTEARKRGVPQEQISAMYDKFFEGYTQFIDRLQTEEITGAQGMGGQPVGPVRPVDVPPDPSTPGRASDIIRESNNALDDVRNSYDTFLDRDMVLKQLRDNGASHIEAKVVGIIMDLAAERWAKQNPGKKAADWWSEHIASIERGGEAGGINLDQLFQLPDDEIVRKLSESAEPFRVVKPTKANWEAEFGIEGKVNTPIGEVIFGKGQFQKLMRKGRNAFMGLIKPTLENPTFIVEKEDGSILYIKAFEGNNGQIQFMSVSRDINRIATVVSNYPVDIGKIKKEIKGGKLKDPYGSSQKISGISPILEQSTASADTLLDNNSLSQFGERFQYSKNTQKGIDLTQKAVDHFGTTRSIREAGYVLPDGTLLDFSGKRDAVGYDKVGTEYVLKSGKDYLANQRSSDHRDVTILYDDDPFGDNPSNYMHDFQVQTGAIRIDVNAGLIDVVGEITPNQAAVLKRWFDGPYIDVTEASTGDYVAHYDLAKARKSRLPQILNQINNYYKNGVELPESGELFQKPQNTPKGSISFLPDGRAVIKVFQGADISTMVHELGHIFRRDLSDDDLDIVAKWSGLTDYTEYRTLQQLSDSKQLSQGMVEHTKWVEAEEKFARGFERWLAGEIDIVPPKVAGVFEQLKQWMLGIYKNITGSAIDVEISPEVRGVFERILFEDWTKSHEYIPGMTEDVFSIISAAYEKANNAPLTEKMRAILARENNSDDALHTVEIIVNDSEHTSSDDLNSIIDYLMPFVEIGNSNAKKYMWDIYMNPNASDEVKNRAKYIYDADYPNLDGQRPAEQLPLFQNADTAGADDANIQKAADLYRSMGVRSPYFKNYFGDWEMDYAYRRNTTTGKALLEEAINQKKDIAKAFYKPEVGEIDLVWGRPGEEKKEYRNGYGLSHIIARRNFEGTDGEAFARGIYNVVAEGNVVRQYGPENGKRIDIETNDSRVVLVLSGDRKSWILTGFELNKNSPDAAGGAYDPTGATPQTPTRSQRLQGAGVESSIAQPPPDFNASKVVDDQGAPLVVYHGTRADFDVFEEGFGKEINDRGIFFTNNKEAADAFASDGRIKAVYLNIRNPLIVDGNGSHWLNLEFEGKKIDTDSLANIARERGNDGVIIRNVKDPYPISQDMYIVLSSEQIKSVNNRGTFNPEDANTLYSMADTNPPAIGSEPPAQLWEGELLDEAWRTKINPLMDKLKARAQERAGEKRFALANLPEDVKGSLKGYLTQVYNQDMPGVKLASMHHGEMMRDFSLLNYQKRYGFDNFLNVAFPYQFWYTRSMMNWAKRALDKPAIFSMYARLRELQQKYQKEGVPTRLKNKMRLAAPWLPEWAGGNLYFDPLKYLFPFDQFGSPLEQMNTKAGNQSSRAYEILRDQVKEGDLTQADFDTAVESKTGYAWTSAWNQAGAEMENGMSNPATLVQMMMQPAMYLTAPYYAMTGQKNKISPLPGTRAALGAETLLKETPLAGLGRIIKAVGAGPEMWARNKLGMSEFGEFGDYYVDRQLSNMTADGEISSDQAIQAMIEKQGPAYEAAMERVRMEQAVKVPGLSAVGPISGLLKGNTTPGEAAGGVLASMFPAGILSKGEIVQRGLYKEYSDAWAAKDAGDKTAVTRFFDEHPEYSARIAQYKEPESRLRNFLTGEIWDRYNDLDGPNKRIIRENLGKQFQDVFLDKDISDYTAVDLETLAYWARFVGGNVPSTPATQPVLNQPLYQGNPVDMYPVTVNDEVQTFWDERSKLFPNITNVESLYYDNGRDKTVLTQFPELREYWDWKKQYYKDHPAVAQYAEKTKQEYDTSVSFGADRAAIENAPQRLTMEDFAKYDDALMRQLMGLVYAGQPLTRGAREELYRVWQQSGRPGGTFEDYVELVTTTMRGKK